VDSEELIPRRPASPYMALLLPTQHARLPASRTLPCGWSTGGHGRWDSGSARSDVQLVNTEKNTVQDHARLVLLCALTRTSGRAALRRQVHTAVTMQAPQRPEHHKLATLGAAIVLIASPVCHPGASDAISWQERLQAAQERKEQALAEACAAALCDVCVACCPADGLLHCLWNPLRGACSSVLL
jgi:hypothetical protein